MIDETIGADVPAVFQHTTDAETDTTFAVAAVIKTCANIGKVQRAIVLRDR